MCTVTLAALFAALLARVHGAAANLKGDTGSHGMNGVDTSHSANLDALGILTADLKPRDAAPQKGQHRNSFPGAPPCGDTWIVPPGDKLTDDNIKAARDSVAKGDKFPKGSKHWICKVQYVICVRIPYGVQQNSKGFWEIARWSNNGDHTTLIALKYWQESITWSVSGSSAKCYLAHGSQWCCAKGKMNWYYEDEDYWLPGNSKKKADYLHTRQIKGPDWGGPCHCGFNLNSDLILSIS